MNTKLEQIKTPKMAIRLENITKTYPNGTVANDGVNFDLKYGEIHAVFGENGAGKTTLMKILLGEAKADSGKIYINGHRIINHNLQVSQNFNIAIIHQHFSLIDNFSIFENVILGYEIAHNPQTKAVEQEYHQRLTQLNSWYQTQTPSAFLEKRYQLAIKRLNLWKNSKIKHFFCYQETVRKELKTIIKKFNLNLQVGVVSFRARVKGFFQKLFGKTEKKEINHQNQKRAAVLDRKAFDLIDQLSVSKRQKVEILKILFKNAEIIIFDEPTSTISASEIKDFLQSLAIYKAAGKAVVFISHKLKEIRQIADRITVLKAGKVVGSFANDQTITDRRLIDLMIGELVVSREKEASKTSKGLPARDDTKLVSISKLKRTKVKAEKLLEISDLNLTQNGKKVLKNINLTLKKGEIVGLSGIEDNGQKELLEIIARISKADSGKLIYEESLDLEKVKPSLAKKKGITYIPQDRNKEGLIGKESLFFNTFFNNWSDPTFFQKGIIKKKAVAKTTATILAKYQVTGATSPFLKAGHLSGGNQQKFIIGREMMTNPKLLLIHEPTWGIDVKTINHLNQLMIELRNQGNTIFFASAELEEILKLSDRVLVINKGEIKGEVAVSDQDVIKKIGHLMTI